MLQNSSNVDPKLVAAIRTIIYRERGKAPLSVVISSLRSVGWSKLGHTDDFQEKCKQAGFEIEHHYKKGDPTSITRTFIKLQEEELA